MSGLTRRGLPCHTMLPFVPAQSLGFARKPNPSALVRALDEHNASYDPRSPAEPQACSRQLSLTRKVSVNLKALGGDLGVCGGGGRRGERLGCHPQKPTRAREGALETLTHPFSKPAP